MAFRTYGGALRPRPCWVDRIILIWRKLHLLYAFLKFKFDLSFIISSIRMYQLTKIVFVSFHNLYFLPQRTIKILKNVSNGFLTLDQYVQSDSNINLKLTDTALLLIVKIVRNLWDQRNLCRTAPLRPYISCKMIPNE